MTEKWVMCLLIIGDDKQRWFDIVGDSDGSHREWEAHRGQLPPQMTPTDLKTPDTPSEASLSCINPPIDPWSSLLIPSNLHWSPINLLWSGTCPSADNQMTVHDSPMASGSFPGTNMTPCLLYFWLLTPQLTHSLTNHADWYAYSFLYSAMSHFPYAYSYCLSIAYCLITKPLLFSYQSLTNSAYSPSFCICNTVLPPCI